MSIKAYISKNTSSLFDEMMTKLDDPNFDHELFQSFRSHKDQRGYVVEFNMNEILVYAFAGEE